MSRRNNHIPEIIGVLLGLVLAIGLVFTGNVDQVSPEQARMHEMQRGTTNEFK